MEHLIIIVRKSDSVLRGVGSNVLFTIQISHNIPVSDPLHIIICSHLLIAMHTNTCMCDFALGSVMNKIF